MSTAYGFEPVFRTGRAAVWRTSDGGSSWRQLDKGLPAQDAFLGVLREQRWSRKPRDAEVIA